MEPEWNNSPENDDCLILGLRNQANNKIIYTQQKLDSNNKESCENTSYKKACKKNNKCQ